MCSREVLASHSALRLAELEQTTVGLHQELARLRLENSRLQERNIQLAAELAVRPGARQLQEQEEEEEEEGRSDTSDVNTLMPGDSFPAVAASLDIISDGEVAEGEQEEETDSSRLLARLTRGGSRMEQIKRQLVVQRGAIVQALRLLAETRSQASRNQSLESSGSSSREGDGSPGGKLCPMCEAQFAAGEEEAMEQHVMDHFVWDEDQDTMLYVGDEEPGSERL